MLSLSRTGSAACVAASAALFAVAATPVAAAPSRTSHLNAATGSVTTPPRAHAPHGLAGRHVRPMPRRAGSHHALARASAVGSFTRGNLYCLTGSRLWIGGVTPAIRSANQTIRYQANVYWWNGSRWVYWFTPTQYTNSGTLSSDIFSQSLSYLSWTGGQDSSSTLLYAVPAGYSYLVQQVLHWYPASGDPTGADAWDYANAGYGSTSCRAS
jgi:hypothetical protein